MHGDAALFDAPDCGGRSAAVARGALPVSATRSADFRDPALDRSRPAAVADAAAPQPGHRDLPRAVLRSTPTRAAARWRSCSDNWAALEPKVAIFGGDTNLIRSLSAFCDAGSRDRDQGVLRRASSCRPPDADAGPDARADQQLHRAAREADAGGRRSGWRRADERAAPPASPAYLPYLAYCPNVYSSLHNKVLFV